MIQIGDLLSHYVYGGGKLPPLSDCGYQYLMAGNGLFVRARNRFCEAMLALAPADVRGLPPLAPYVKLNHRKLPGQWLTMIIDHARQHIDKEVLYQIIQRDGRFGLKVAAYGTQATISNYDDAAPASDIVCDFHSHNMMGAFFSPTDNQFEQDFRWYGVVGKLHKSRPCIALRLGIYGYHFPLPLHELFDFTNVEPIWRDDEYDQHRETI